DLQSLPCARGRYSDSAGLSVAHPGWAPVPHPGAGGAWPEGTAAPRRGRQPRIARCAGPASAQAFDLLAEERQLLAELLHQLGVVLTDRPDPHLEEAESEGAGEVFLLIAQLVFNGCETRNVGVALRQRCLLELLGRAEPLDEQVVAVVDRLTDGDLRLHRSRLQL